MKSKRKILRTVTALVLCLSLAVGAYAVSAGIYTYISGSSKQSTQNPSLLSTTTRIGVNPDNAYLRTDVEFSNGTSMTSSAQKYSSRGVVSFTYNFPIYQSIDKIPIYAFVAHNVLGGTQSETGYVYRTTASINLS